MSFTVYLSSEEICMFRHGTLLQWTTRAEPLGQESWEAGTTQRDWIACLSFTITKTVLGLFSLSLLRVMITIHLLLPTHCIPTPMIGLGKSEIMTSFAVTVYLNWKKKKKKILFKLISKVGNNLERSQGTLSSLVIICWQSFSVILTKDWFLAIALPSCINQCNLTPS